MKLTQKMMCAMAAGAMAFAARQAQAVVIDNVFYVPVNITATASYVAGAGQIQQTTVTSKNILNSTGNYPSGTMLAVNPNGDHVYAIHDGAILDDLTAEGYIYFTTAEYINTSAGSFPSTASTYSEAGIVTLDYYSDGNSGIDFPDNALAFELTGAYAWSTTSLAVTSGYYHVSSKFGSSSLGGYGYALDLDPNNQLPMSGGYSGSGSGKLAE